MRRRRRRPKSSFAKDARMGKEIGEGTGAKCDPRAPERPNNQGIAAGNLCSTLGVDCRRMLSFAGRSRLSERRLHNIVEQFITAVRHACSNATALSRCGAVQEVRQRPASTLRRCHRCGPTMVINERSLLAAFLRSRIFMLGCCDAAREILQ
jgi:hypothetical protein